VGAGPVVASLAWAILAIGTKMIMNDDEFHWKFTIEAGEKSFRILKLELVTCAVGKR
jgi:hypothetical protein